MLRQDQSRPDHTRPDHKKNKNSGLADTKTRQKIKVGKVAKKIPLNLLGWSKKSNFRQDFDMQWK